MKIRILFSIMLSGIIVFFLTALPIGCAKSSEQQQSTTETVQPFPKPSSDTAQVAKTPVSDTKDEPASTENRSIEATEEADKPTTQQPKPTPKPVEEKKTPAAQKKATTTVDPPPVKKAETTAPPTTTTKTEAPKTGEQPKTAVTEPVPEPVKPTEPTPPKPEKIVEPVAPKPEKPVEPAEAKPATPKPVPQAANWPVPESANKKPNPINADNASFKLGKSLWKKHCASCHGNSGLGDGSKAAQLDTPSGDFTIAAFQAQTDGALFYKTVEGRDDMPSYKKKIPDEEDIWHLVNFMRTLK